MSDTLQHTPKPCPWCRQMLGRLQRPDRPPQFGEASVCGACGRPLWYDTDGTIRQLTTERMRLLPRSVQKGLYNTQRAVVDRIAAKQEAERQRRSVRPVQPSHSVKYDAEE